MKSKIQEIVKKVPRGCIFDSHFVINILRERFSDQYLSFAGRSGGKQQPTLPTHGKIGQAINKLDGIKKIDFPSWSQNIRGRPSRCTCWRKL